MDLDAEITTPEACKLLGITSEWLRQVSKQGYYSQVSRGRWRLKEVVQGYLRYLQAEERRTTKTAADSRVRDARAAEIELRTAERMRQVIRTDESIAIVDAIIGAMRTEADGIGARCTRDLDMRHKIESEIDDTLRRASGRLEKWAADVEAGHLTPAPGRPFNS